MSFTQLVRGFCIGYGIGFAIIVAINNGVVDPLTAWIAAGFLLVGFVAHLMSLNS